MLGKLLKYEIKATARNFLPFFVAIITLSIVNKISLTFFRDPIPALELPQALLALLYVFMIIAAFVLCVIMTIQRFYKNLLGQEGHLMFTLPVSASANILSKGIAALMWLLGTFLVTALSILILVPDYGCIRPFGREWLQLVQEVRETAGLNLNLIMIMVFIIMLAAICTFIMEVYAAVSIGQLANSHKLLCSFGAFLGISIVEQIINSIILTWIVSPHLNRIADIYNTSHHGGFVTNGMSGIAFTHDASGYVITAFILFGLITEVAYCVAWFFISRWILKNKLNLE